MVLVGSGGDLVSPCPCRGSLRDVHLECLELWHLSEERWTLVCATCGHCYAPGPAKLRLATALMNRIRGRARGGAVRVRGVQPRARPASGVTTPALEIMTTQY